MPRKQYVVWTAEDEATLRRMVETGHSYPEIADALGRPLHPVQQKARKLGLGIRQAKVASAAREALAPDGTRAIASPHTTQPVTLDALLRTFGLDADAWDVIECTPNVWQIGAKHPVSGEILTAPLYQLKARLRPKLAPLIATLRAQLLADVQADSAQRPKLSLRALVPDDGDGEPCLLEIELPDIHIGKLAWGDETGTDYDSRIAERIAREAVTDLLWQAARYRIARIVLPIGSDLLHYDTALGLTTAGTPQDRDTRWLLMFRRARGLASWMIETCARVAPVEVIVIAGNHATQAELALGEVLIAEYAQDKRVTFNASPTQRKYVAWGRNLIGFTHGDKEPHEKLPQIMAVEEPAKWAASTYREFHLGHLHKGRKTEPVTVDDKTGVTVRILRSLSGVDAWHASKGYVGTTRGAEAFVYRASGGLRAHLFTYPTASRTAGDDAAEVA